MPVLGSFQEGFYDPLTTKPRRISVEILRTVSYWLFDPTYYSTNLENETKNKPVITFDNIPSGLVALNHPDWLCNYASSEIFALQSKKPLGKLDLLTGQYSVFGYIINNVWMFWMRFCLGMLFQILLLVILVLCIWLRSDRLVFLICCREMISVLM